MADLTKTEAWAALTAHEKTLSRMHIRDLFAADPRRLDWSITEAAGLTLDISKNRITGETLKLLVDLANARDVAGWRGRMAAGESVNTSEGRAALHMALRGTCGRDADLGAGPVGPTVKEALKRFLDFARGVHDGSITGPSGKRFETVIHIGIGGSDLGPRLVADALRAHNKNGISVRFVANIDASELLHALEGTDPETTLFVVASKTFTTQETIENAKSARTWLEAVLPKADVPAHFAGVTANTDAARVFGIADAQIFPFWDWVGGRFSVWSSVGLSLALAIGADGFEDFLAGAAQMDEHFCTAPFEQNMPVLLALVGLWNRNFLECSAHAVLPYDHGLSLLPSYLQQLEMESNGKSVQRDGAPVDAPTSPAVWGVAGTTGQHAFYQWLHQGTDIASSDVILPLKPHHHLTGHHDILTAHAIAQAEALAFGRNAEETKVELAAEGLSGAQIQNLLRHRTFPGNRPVSVLTMERLTPKTLGALLALYEHKVFTQGILWNINSFDQWGVELGKTVAGRALEALVGEGRLEGFDASTRRLIEAARIARSSKPSGT